MAEVPEALELLDAISLEETNQIASLHERVDRKYLIPRGAFVGIAAELAERYAALEIAGKRTLEYDTVYFDTADRLCYRSHLQGRRVRFKLRSRHYRESGLCFFELKVKDARGKTIKERIDQSSDSHGAIDATARAFASSALSRRFGIELAADLSRSLDVRYTRATLVDRAGGTRVTCDFDLSFHTPSGGDARLGAGYLLVETKGSLEPSYADVVLRRHGQRPVKCSKYCVGLGAADPRVKNNPLRPVLRRYFDVPQLATMEVSFR